MEGLPVAYQLIKWQAQASQSRLVFAFANSSSSGRPGSRKVPRMFIYRRESSDSTDEYSDCSSNQYTQTSY